MPKLVPIPPSKVFHILRVLGYEEVRIRGSHHFFEHPISHKCTTVPAHSNEILGVGALKMIFRDIGISVKEYEKLRLLK